MRLTNKQLKRIIKEEIDSLMNEAENNEIEITDKEIESGKKMQDTPIGNAIFKMLLKDPKVQQELEKIGSQTNEGEGAALPVLGAIGNTAVAAPAIQKAVMTGLTSGKLGTAVAGVLKAAGLAGGAMVSGAAAGFLVFIALGGAAALLGKGSMSLKPGSEKSKALDDKIDKMKIGDIDPDLGRLISKDPAKFEAV